MKKYNLRSDVTTNNEKLANMVSYIIVSSKLARLENKLTDAETENEKTLIQADIDTFKTDNETALSFKPAYDVLSERDKVICNLFAGNLITFNTGKMYHACVTGKTVKAYLKTLLFTVSAMDVPESENALFKAFQIKPIESLSTIQGKQSIDSVFKAIVTKGFGANLTLNSISEKQFRVQVARYLAKCIVLGNVVTEDMASKGISEDITTDITLQETDFTKSVNMESIPTLVKGETTGKAKATHKTKTTK